MKKLFVLNGGAAVKPGLKGAMLDIKEPQKFFRTAGINTGDVLVYDATLKETAYDTVSNVQFSAAADQNLWPVEEPDLTIIRGSNYLTASLDLGHVVPLVERLKGPIVAIGVGAQASSYHKLKVPKGSVRFWKTVADKCETIGVRGYYSAEVFNDIGIKNVRVMGCPSFYRSLAPEIKLRPVNVENARLGLTLNRYLSADYASSTVKTNRLQRALLKEIADRDNSRFYSQGERAESLAMVTAGEEKAELIKKVLGAFGLQDDANVTALLSDRMSAHFDVDAWAEDVGRNVDCMLGFRLHGNVIALHQGIPAIFFTYDSRIRELASFFHAPVVDIDDFLPVKIDELIERADFGAFETAYRNNYAEYKKFLDENHVVNRLVDAKPEGAPTDSINAVPMAYTNEELIKWMRSEVDYLASSNETLRTRAWNLEKSVRSMREEAAKAMDEAAPAPEPQKS